jgi:hypothetical protein
MEKEKLQEHVEVVTSRLGLERKLRVNAAQELKSYPPPPPTKNKIKSCGCVKW